MHFGLGHALVVTALAASVWLVFQGGNRLFPIIAAVAAGVEALIAFDIISLSVARFRIDVILPALLLVGAGVCWSRSSSKGAITAATAASLVGALQLLIALRVFG
jgi:hypothetical protein